MKKLILILATQRSGSTLLCRDIEGLGGVGVPREHLLPMVRADRPAFNAGRKMKANNETVMESLQLGLGSENQTDVGSVKLMVSYAPQVYQNISGKLIEDRAEAMQEIINWTRNQFEHVALVSIVRKSIMDQAISRSMARVTDVFHHRSPKGKQETDPYAKTKIDRALLNRNILDNLTLVRELQSDLLSVIKNNKSDILNINYDTLSRNADYCQKKLYDHLVSNNITPENKRAKRYLRKLIDTDRSEKIKSDFFEYLLGEMLNKEDYAVLRDVLDNPKYAD
ncbi:Stf0 family sulfotransferase [Paramylibacter kogurei]|nr:Stf0 family sulfotransferase [Amylibacter kogurei]